MIDIGIKSPDRATALALLESVGLLLGVVPEQRTTRVHPGYWKLTVPQDPPDNGMTLEEWIRDYIEKQGLDSEEIEKLWKSIEPIIEFSSTEPDLTQYPKGTTVEYIEPREEILVTPEYLRWESGVAYDEHAITIVVKPAVYSTDAKTGNEMLVSPAEIDPNYHANIRFWGPNAEELAAKLEKGGIVRNSLALAKATDEATAKTKAVRNRVVSGVTLFRFGGADGVKTPARTWL